MPGRLAPLLLGLTLSLTCGTAAFAQGATVTVEEVRVREVVDTRPVIAQLVGTVQSRIATRSDGVIDEVLFSIGDHVRAGQDLVRLDRSLLEIERAAAVASMDVAQAGVEVAKAQVRLAEQGLARQERLKGSTAFSKGQFEDLQQTLSQAMSERARAEAQVAMARAALARIEYSLTHSVIRAPFEGVVIQRDAQPGEYISIGNGVAMVLDTNRLEIAADMPVELITSLQPGDAISARFDDGTSFGTEVRMLLPVQDVSTRTRPVRLRADFSEMPGVPLAAGKNVTLEVPISAPRQAPMVAKDALVQSAGGWTVFVVSEGVAQPRRVTLGPANGGRMEVLSGLAPGDLVVVRGNERLQPGQPVTPTLADGPDAVTQDGG